MSKQKEQDEIKEEYGKVIEPDLDGFYSITGEEAETLLNKNGIVLDDYRAYNQIAEDIRHLWKDQTKMITSKTLDDYSIQESGLAYKYYLLCEEYLKDSNITHLSNRLDLSRPTIYEWLKREDVQKYLQERRKEIEANARQTYTDTFNTCFTALSEMITREFAIDNTDKIRAIDTFLKHYENLERIEIEKYKRN